MLSFNSRGGSSTSKSTKVAPFSGVASMKIPDLHQQVQQQQEELKKEREDKSRILEELTQIKKKSNSQINGSEFGANKRMDMLEKEVEKAKQSERNMQESLIVQTKQFEETKIRLAEAKLVIQRIKSRENHEKNGDQEERKALRAELKIAIEAEENANEAMNDLALLLKEVKDELSTTKRELGTMKTEADENTLAWLEKEKSFLNCVKESTDENNRLKQENTKLFESQKVIREENSKLRENLKKSLEKINSLKEELEANNRENSRLNNVLTEKEDALQNLKLDYESLRVIEAAAQRSLKELNGMLGFENTPKKASSPYSNPSPYSYPSSKGNLSPNEFKETNNGKDGSPKENSFILPSKFSIACTEEFDQMDRESFVSLDCSVMNNKKKKNVFRKLGSIFKGKSFRAIPPLPPIAPRASFSV